MQNRKAEKTAALNPHTTPTLTGIALVWREYHATRRNAVLASMQSQVDAFRAELRAKWLKRAAEGDVDAVLYILANGW